ncbi:SDR family NAD(P)-dependent oxidoreductase [Luteimonas sp. e5]
MSDPGPLPLQDRVVLVAGATGGLGQAAALACARAGAEVVLLGRHLRRLNRVHDAIAAVAAAPLLYPMDLEGATPDDHLELALRLKQEFGRLDGLLHCAAEFRGLTPLELSDPADIARILHVNVTAPMWLTSACLPLLKAAGEAAVVFVVDDAGTHGQPFWGAYAASQQARAALVPLWNRELEGSGVAVRGLQPGPMRSGIRARAMIEDLDPDLRAPECYAADCVRLLTPAAAAWNGRIQRVQAEADIAPAAEAAVSASRIELPTLRG